MGLEMLREVEPAYQRLVNLPKAGEVSPVEEVEGVEENYFNLFNWPQATSTPSTLYYKLK